MAGPELKSIKGKQIFSAGTWNGDVITVDDLDSMVRAFEETSDRWLPPVKLGHAKEQKLLQEDGLPAAGWISALYRMGEKLYADFVDMPEKIYELVKRKAYNEVSAEVFWDIDIEGKVYHRMLAGVALLGSDLPAVTCLDDFMALYGVKTGGRINRYAARPADLIIRRYGNGTDRRGSAAMPEKTQAEKDLEKQLETERANAAKFSKDAELKTAELKTKDDELATLRQYRADADARAAVSAIDTEVGKLIAAKLCTPAMKPFISELLGVEKKTYSVAVGKDGAKKDFTRAELLTHALKLFAATAGVNAGDPLTDDGDPEAVESEQRKSLDATHEQIEKYSKEHKVSYSAAAKAILRKATEKKTG